MESKEQFKSSLEELEKLDKHTSATVFSIDTSKLDSVTKGRLLLAIRQVISDRKKDITNVITRIDNQI